MAGGVEFDKIENAVNSCCLGGIQCEECMGESCLIGFPKKVVNFFNSTHEKVYPQGLDRIPTSDMKIYDEEQLSDAVAEILVQCRECNDNHKRDCVIGTIRASIERGLLGENLDDYKGNPLSHVLEISKVNPVIGDMLLKKYKAAKAAQG